MWVVSKVGTVVGKTLKHGSIVDCQRTINSLFLSVEWKQKMGGTDVLVHPFFSIRFAGLILRNILQNIQQMIPNHLYRWNEQTLVRGVDVAQGRAKADHV